MDLLIYSPENYGIFKVCDLFLRRDYDEEYNRSIFNIVGVSNSGKQIVLGSYLDKSMAARIFEDIIKFFNNSNNRIYMLPPEIWPEKL